MNCSLPCCQGDLFFFFRVVVWDAGDRGSNNLIEKAESRNSWNRRDRFLDKYIVSSVATGAPKGSSTHDLRITCASLNKLRMPILPSTCLLLCLLQNLPQEADERVQRAPAEETGVAVVGSIWRCGESFDEHVVRTLCVRVLRNWSSSWEFHRS